MPNSANLTDSSISGRTANVSNSNASSPEFQTNSGHASTLSDNSGKSLPELTLPKGGGAVRGIGEKFTTNSVTGTGSMAVPISVSPGRSGFSPHLSLSYDSGAGNGPFGLGWSLALPMVTRKTDKGLPKYDDKNDADVYLLSGAEDLVPEFRRDQNGVLVTNSDGSYVVLDEERTTGPISYRVRHYRPRTEGLFSRIERWTRIDDLSIHWRSITRYNVTTLYGFDSASRIADPQDPTRIYCWHICASFDDKGNAMRYHYKREDSIGIDLGQIHERHRSNLSRSSQIFPYRICYGNVTSVLDIAGKVPQPCPDFEKSKWHFELVFDYGEGYLPTPQQTPKSEEEVLFNATPTKAWPVRPDPFSICRATFEVRTYRRCQRMLMLHHFPTELGTQSCLVGSTDLAYNESPFGSELTSVTHSGYVRRSDNTYLRRSIPSVEFEYSHSPLELFTIDDFSVRELDESTVANLPGGLEEGKTSWADIDGEGLPGIVSEVSGQWYYRANRGEGSFGPLQTVPSMPVGASLSGGQMLLDLAGDGQLDLVSFNENLPGFFERNDDHSWESFQAFRSLPRLSWQDPNLRFVDLTGDGHADVFVTSDSVHVWYPSIAEDGFGAGVALRVPCDEESGPRILFSDERKLIFLADMTGDGLSDIVRVEQGQVCYWPNLGYGSFGAKVVMDNSPWFESADVFNHGRVHFFDTDGSGPSDLVYERQGSIDIFLNQGGNRWTSARSIRSLPTCHSQSRLDVTDLLGRGTACLVRSTPLEGDRTRPLAFIDLMKGVKPRLLTRVTNNLGAETRIDYASSTMFYLDDVRKGKPWITRLPFPVHVVTRVETNDLLSGNRFVSKYSYHHGYFDGEEREFRGFGRVEQLDTEELASVIGRDASAVATNIDDASYVPPIRTVTWFHTGSFLNRDRITRQYLHEYFQERDPNSGSPDELTPDEVAKLFLPDTVLPEVVNGDEEREACRALRGSILRQEIYSLDGGKLEAIPYATSERNYTIEYVQPRAQNRHAVFLSHAREQLDVHYERRMLADGSGQSQFDPRVTHAMTLAVDQFGNVERSLSIAYPRRNVPTRAPEQTLTHITLSVTKHANRNTELDWYRVGVPVQQSTYEWVKPPEPAFASFRHSLLAFDDMAKASESLFPSGQLAPPSSSLWPTQNFDWRTHPVAPLSGSKLRLMSSVRSLYRRDDLSAPLPLGEIESLALPYESYKLASTPDLLAEFGEGHFTSGMLSGDGRYVHSQGDLNWWVPSGRVFYSPGSNDTPAQERAFARKHFFLPIRFRDPFYTDTVSTESRIQYDAYDLSVVQSEDALGNKVSAGVRDLSQTLTQSSIDYRVLQPRLLMDPNRNQTSVTFDALGMVVATAVMGKPEEHLGDSLDGLDPDLPETMLLNRFENPTADPQSFLGRATSRIAYDLFAWQRTKSQPARVYSIVRETHDSDLSPGVVTKVQHRFTYSDGFGREMQTKIQAEPGPVPRRDPTTGKIDVVNGQPQMTTANSNPRWVGSGWVIFNNKGKPVRQFEPFFTDSERYERDIRIGVSSTLLYDPLERVVATLHPDHTWQKVVFDPWQQATWDGNDTVQFRDPDDPTVFRTDPRLDPDVGRYFKRLPTDEFLPTWFEARIDGSLGLMEQKAAEKTLIHAETPMVSHVDSAGQTFLTIAHNRFQMSSSGSTPQEQFPQTRIVFDAEGRQRQVIDARGNKAMIYDCDILGNVVRQQSIDAGKRLLLNDIAGKSIFARDDKGQEQRPTYDQLHRPVAVRLKLAGDPTEIVIERRVYGESLTSPEATNMRGKLSEVHDQAGLQSMVKYDFKGNLIKSTRQFAIEYKAPLNWAGSVAIQSEAFAAETTFDALNRPSLVTSPDGSQIQLGYNEASLLEKVTAQVVGSGTGVITTFVSNIDHDAKGQRTRIDYGNGTSTTYEYDPLTYRLTRLLTKRDSSSFSDDGRQPPPTGFPGRYIQDLNYTYDPIGNITSIRDDAQQTIFFQNRKVEPSCEFLYDATYRLIEATGREHLGLAGGVLNSPTSPDAWNRFQTGLAHPGDGNAVGRYLERYLYDLVGNFIELQHVGTEPTNGIWNRSYTTAATSNRLLGSTVSGSPTETFDYDLNGNMITFAHLSDVTYDHHDQMRTSTKGLGAAAETTYYIYDGSGQRVRKVTESPSGRKREHYYIGGYEVHREYAGDGTTVEHERTTLHVMDDKSRIALVEHRTLGDDGTAKLLIRFQHGNHLGTVSLELDESGHVINYEEYAPYGSTTYQSQNSSIKAAAKRYRYTGKERDEETGFNYHGARYCAPWMGRWTTVDPAGLVDGTNVYGYANNNPVRLHDPSGRWGEDMHFLAVYWTGRIQGANHVQSLIAALGSQHFDDTPRDLNPLNDKKKSLDAPSLKTSFVEGDRQLGNNLHSLNLTRSESQTIAKQGIKDQNVLLFGMGLHTVADFLPHFSASGEYTFGHQTGFNEDFSLSKGTMPDADFTSKNPRKALNTFETVGKLWSQYLGKHSAVALEGNRFDEVKRFILAEETDSKGKLATVVESLKAMGVSEADIADVTKYSSSTQERDKAVNAMLQTVKGSNALATATGMALGLKNNSNVFHQNAGDLGKELAGTPVITTPEFESRRTANQAAALEKYKQDQIGHMYPSEQRYSPR